MPLEGGDRSAAAVDAGAMWAKGLEGSGLGPDDMRAVKNGVTWQLITPGAASGAPLDILPALGVPAGWDPRAIRTAPPIGSTA